MADVHIEVSGLTMAYDDFIIQQDLNFKIHKGDIFIVMGGNGCGKSTLLRHLLGLKNLLRAIFIINSKIYGRFPLKNVIKLCVPMALCIKVVPYGVL